jgi:hypothetical protein
MLTKEEQENTTYWPLEKESKCSKRLFNDLWKFLQNSVLSYGKERPLIRFKPLAWSKNRRSVTD